MLRIPVHIPILTRRQFLQVGAVAISGFDLLPMTRPLNVFAKENVKLRGTGEYCLFVFLQGGASHVDTFDVKEGRWTPEDFDIRAVNPKLRLPVGLFPKLAEKIDRVAIVRSLETWETEHGRATYYLHVAHPISPARLREIPSLGAVVAYESRTKRKDSEFLPPFVSMNYGTDKCTEGCLDSRFGPLNLDTSGGDFSFVVPEKERSRFNRRVAYLNAMAALAPGANDPGRLPEQQLDVYRSDALAMMQSPRMPKILQVDDEDKKRYGGSPFGVSCILARNILAAEAGTRFVALHHGSWDFHANIYDKSKGGHYSLSRDLDAGLAGLIGDMEKIKTADGHSLLDKTLIVVLGEFGRTPGDITVNKGRDHHRFAMSGLFAGAGVVGGRAIGATDEKGARVTQPGWALKRSIYPEDVATTIYSVLGIDWTKEITHTPSGRVFRYVDPMSGTEFLNATEISELFSA